jgi:surfeit locus 1 family protein
MHPVVGAIDSFAASDMHDAPRPPRSTAALAVLLAGAALACAGFAWLGVWQVHRLAWKEALIAHVDRAVHADPAPPPPRAQWPSLRREQDEYRRIRVEGRFAFDRDVLVRASTELGAGYWVITPLQLDDGSWLLVNRGFVNPELRGRVPHDGERQTVVGLLRFTEPGGTVLQSNAPAQGRWYSRDVQAIAQAEHLAGPVAPYFLDEQATPATAQRWPRPGLTVIRFPNDHLQYALTWFALAAMVAAAIGYLLLDERRLRRVAGEPRVADRTSST